MTDLPKDEMFCPHCDGDIAIRDPSGYCDHLYYPDNCEECKKLQSGEKPIVIKIPAEFARDHFNGAENAMNNLKKST